MAFFRNLGVNLRDSLCDVLKYASSQFLDFLDLAQKFSFLDWKHNNAQYLFVDGH
jgi:prepilin-type processing-associated H-X9-DG protein